MASQSSPKTPKSGTMDTSTSRAPSKSNQTHASSSSVRILEPLDIAALSPSPPAGQGRQPQAGRPMGGRPASPRGRSSPGSVESYVQGPGLGALMRSHVRSPTRPTTWVLSPRKVMTKCMQTSSGGACVAQVGALQVVQLDSSTYSPEYFPASPSPPRYRVTEAKVGRGKVLTPPLDRVGIDLPPGSVRCHIRPPPIRDR